MGSESSARRKKDPPFRFEWERAVRATDLFRTTKQFLLTLATYMNIDGTSTFPGTKTLADSMSVSISTVKRHRRTAIERGFLGKAREGQGTTTILYEFRIPEMTRARQDDQPAKLSGGVTDDTGVADDPTPGVAGDPPPGSQVTPNQIKDQHIDQPSQGESSSSNDLVRVVFDEWGVPPGSRRFRRADAELVAETCGTEAAVKDFVAWAKDSECKGPGGWRYFIGDWQAQRARGVKRKRSTVDSEAIANCGLCIEAGWRIADWEHGIPLRCDHKP